MAKDGDINASHFGGIYHSGSFRDS